MYCTGGTECLSCTPGSHSVCVSMNHSLVNNILLAWLSIIPKPLTQYSIIPKLPTQYSIICKPPPSFLSFASSPPSILSFVNSPLHPAFYHLFVSSPPTPHPLFHTASDEKASRSATRTTILITPSTALLLL